MSIDPGRILDIIQSIIAIEKLNEQKQKLLDELNGLKEGICFQFRSKINLDRFCLELAYRNESFGYMELIEGKLGEQEKDELQNLATIAASIFSNYECEEDDSNAILKDRVKYKLLFENSPVGVFTYDSTGKILDANEKLVSILGSPDREKTKKLNVFYLPQLVEAGISKHLEKCVQKGLTMSSVKYYNSVWGKKLYLKYTITPLIYKEHGTSVAQVIVEDFTRYKETEEALIESKLQAEKSESQIKGLLNAIPDLIFVFDEDGIFLDFSARGQDLYVPPSTFLNKHVSAVLPPKIANQAIEKIKNALGTGSAQVYEYSITINNKEHFYDVRMVPLSNNRVLSISRDITPIKTAEKELKKNNSNLQLQNKISNAFLSFDDNQFFERVLQIIINQFKCEYGILGYIDQNGDLVCPTLTRSIWKNRFDIEGDVVLKRDIWAGLWGHALVQNSALYKNENLKFPEGHVQLKNAMASPINNEKYEVIGEIVVGNKSDDFNDGDRSLLMEICNYLAPLLTARLKEIEYKQQLIRSKEKAEQSDKLKSAFLANLSHEIRTPMNGIVGFAQLLKRDGIHVAKFKRYVDIINRQSFQLLGIISDIVDISKLDTGMLSVFEDEINLRDLIEELYAIFKREHKGSEVELAIQTDPIIEFVYSDRTKIMQILTNLLNNAYKHTAEGRITLGYFVEKEKVRFYVSDTGPGIPEEEFNHIFERFIQLEGPNKKTGTGLGLSICEGMAELLGGEMSVESKEGSGSTFYFSLPLTKKADF